MKILCLGAGSMGALAAETLAGFDEIHQMTIADLNLDSAKRVAGACLGKAAACAVSVEDAEGLTTLMRGHDAVVNCVGSFFRFAVPILTCAIRAGVNYFDICDDPEPTLDMLKMGKEAEAAGIMAIVGIGATPGITNMLAAKVYGKFQRVSELHAAWNIEEKESDAPEAVVYSAAIVHWMQQCSGKILECRDGRLQEVKPLEEVKLHYPGLGDRPVWTVGHPEPVAFSWSYPEIEKSSCYMVMPSMTADYFKKLAGKIDAGRLTLEEAGRQLVDEVKNISLLDHILAVISGIFDRPRLPMFFVIGKGEIEGRRATVAATIKASPPGMARATGIPLAIGVHQFAQGRIKLKGVATPEKALDADAFFLELAPYCTFPSRAPNDDIVDIVQEFRE
jgi:saccharopine dehydrogenase-like NADP-dependent oxidoreductase